MKKWRKLDKLLYTVDMELNIYRERDRNNGTRLGGRLYVPGRVRSLCLVTVSGDDGAVIPAVESCPSKPTDQHRSTDAFQG